MKTFILLITFLLFAVPSQAKQSLTLNKIIKEVLKHSPSLKFANRKVEAARFSRKKETAKRWLKVDFYAGIERHSEPISVVPISAPGKFPKFSRDIYSWELKASIPIYDGGKVSKLVKIKNLEVFKEKRGLQQSAEDLIANVKELYFTILYLKALKKTNEELLEILKKEERLASLKYKAGKVAELDLLYFKRARLQEEASLEEIKKKLKAAKEVLLLLMGWQDKEDIDVKGKIFEVNFSQIPDVASIDRLIEGRTDVRIAYLKVRQAEVNLNLARRENLPQLYLFSSYGERAGAGLNYKKNLWTVGIQLKISIFDSGVTKYNIMEKQENLLATKQALNSVKLKAKEEVVNALAEINSCKAKIRKYKAAVVFAKEVFEKESLKYRTGAGSVVDLLSAQETWLKAKMSLIKAFFDLSTAMVKFELATGQIAKGYLNE